MGGAWHREAEAARLSDMWLGASRAHGSRRTVGVGLGGGRGGVGGRTVSGSELGGAPLCPRVTSALLVAAAEGVVCKGTGAGVPGRAGRQTRARPAALAPPGQLLPPRPTELL